MNTSVEFSHVSRCFGDVVAVDDVSIKIPEGEFFSMLGPSGSGKTTCLRLVAGFEQPSNGHIFIHGKDATGLPPYQRDVNTVFQDYALFPHMNISENVAYGLMVKGVGGKERQARTLDALKLVDLETFGDRKPSQLSGGQRQRVALARALVNRPRVLLLDEPLGALDQKLREQMQSELKAIQRKLGITFIFVTHDQSEALSMSDRVAVFNKGKIEQVDTPRALYNQPSTRFVAEFVGTSNVITDLLAQQLTGQAHAFSIRPEHIQVNDASAADDSVKVAGRVSEILYQGSNTRFEIQLSSGERIATELPNDHSQLTSALNNGDEVMLSWARSAMVSLREGV